MRKSARREMLAWSTPLPPSSAHRPDDASRRIRTPKRSHDHSLGELAISATSSADIVTAPLLSAVDVNPEEAFVAALSRSHRLRFLEIAAMFGYLVEHYSDMAEGSTATNSSGNLWLAHVILQPAILFTGTKIPSDAAVLAIHRAAHSECSLANSVSTLVETLGVWHHEPCVGSD